MSVNHKIYRTANAPNVSADETETAVAQALVDLENNVPELKTELRPLQISAAREVDVRGGKKAIVVFVPVPQLKAFRKVQQRCVFSIFIYFSFGLLLLLEEWVADDWVAFFPYFLNRVFYLSYPNLGLPDLPPSLHTRHRPLNIRVSPNPSIAGSRASSRRSFRTGTSCSSRRGGCSPSRRARRG